LNLGGVDLVQLEGQEVELSAARGVVAPERAKAPLYLRELLAKRTHRPEVNPGVVIQGLALRRLAQQRLVGVLTVEVDLAAAELFERGERRQPVVDRRPTPSALGNDPNRTSEASLFPPTSSSSASTINVFPVPVSPVIAVRPAPRAISMSSITPSERTRNCSIMERYRSVRPNFARKMP
jgi:hypothetical protein